VYPDWLDTFCAGWKGVSTVGCRLSAEWDHCEETSYVGEKDKSGLDPEVLEDLEIKDDDDAETVRGGAGDVFLKLDGVAGESSDDKHKNL
jgi:hypothetical protein